MILQVYLKNQSNHVVSQSYSDLISKMSYLSTQPQFKNKLYESFDDIKVLNWQFMILFVQWLE